MELAIKKNLNKLPDFIPDLKTVTEHFLNFGFELLPLTNEHIFSYQQLALFAEHKDPFDRFLIAIANCENLSVMSSDSKFKLYSSYIILID